MSTELKKMRQTDTDSAIKWSLGGRFRAGTESAWVDGIFFLVSRPDKRRFDLEFLRSWLIEFSRCGEEKGDAMKVLLVLLTLAASSSGIIHK